MQGQGDRLRRARTDRGYASAAAAAEAFGWNRNTYASNENGNAPFSFSKARTYAAAFHVRAEWLYDGAGAMRASGKLQGYPLIGKVGAGGLGLYADDYEMGAAAELIEAVPGMAQGEEIIVLEVDGESMSPAVFDGDLAFFGPVRHDVEALINKRVMARLADGRKFFKILKRGSSPQVWTLRSLNPETPDIEDVAVAWVLPYRGSRPR